MYCAPEDLRAEGVTEEMASDAALIKKIKAACEKIELWTGLWFEPREKTLFLSGHGGRLLYLDIPALGLTCLSDGEKNIPCTDVRIIDEGYTLLLNPYQNWRRGTRNIEVTGTFGWVIPDSDSPTGYATPSPIIEATKRLTLWEITPLTNMDAQNEQRRAGRIISETTDGHSYTLASTNSNNTATIGTYGAWTGFLH